MLHGHSQPGIAGSELTRLLAALAEHPQPTAVPAFSERLGQWLGWTGAISLSSALQATIQPPSRGASGAAGVPEPEADLDRVHAGLAAQVAEGPPEAGDPGPADFAPYRNHCRLLQQAMQEDVGALRQRMRAALLARACPELARLAAIDAVMDQALAPYERSLLGLVPLRLQAHFERLRSAAGIDGPWISTFRDDMARVMRAELAHRLLPVRGLLAAFRAPRETLPT